MMREHVLFFQNNSNDPYYNQAFEEYVFTTYSDETILLIWQNSPAVVCGNYQNLFAEVNVLESMREGTALIRRPTGGGTVYHDLGNLNYSIIRTCDASTVDYPPFIMPVVKALNEIGIPACINRKSDISINGMKVSGSAQKIVRNRVLHHGTLLFDTDLRMLKHLANGQRDHYTSKGTRSVPWPVVNMREYVPELDVNGFRQELFEHLKKSFSITTAELSCWEIAEINKLSSDKYKSWEWTYGRSPAFSYSRDFIYKNKKIHIQYSAEKGIIQDIKFDEKHSRFEALLKGIRLNISDLQEIFIEIEGYEDLYEYML